MNIVDDRKSLVVPPPTVPIHTVLIETALQCIVVSKSPEWRQIHTEVYSTVSIVASHPKVRTISFEFMLTLGSSDQGEGFHSGYTSAGLVPKNRDCVNQVQGSLLSMFAGSSLTQVWTGD